MRAWGLATGLRDNGHPVTVAINCSFPQTISEHQGIKIANWSENDAFIELINSFDAVIVSYCMGSTSTFVAENIHDDVTLVLDAYVPIYIEVAARDSEDKKTELINYERDMNIANKALKRGDYFLCANKSQLHMYTGILASMGIINPVTYRDDRVLLVPFGVDPGDLPRLTKTNNPYSKLGINEEDFVLLWFGGLYPWFNFEPLLSAIYRLSSNKTFKFVLVGGKNPYNQNPDFIKQYDNVRSKLEESGLLGSSVHMVDWVDFDERIFWYKGADLVISINQDGNENEYSWRTRVMDYVWGELPVLTNGGDPLSELLIDQGAALRIDTSSESVFIELMESLMHDKERLNDLRTNMAKCKNDFYWERVVEPIIERLSSAPFPYARFRDERASWGLGAANTTHSGIMAKTRQFSSYVQKAREKGLIRSTKLALKIGTSIARNQLLATKKRATTTPKVVMLSHPIDYTGAPLVLIDMAFDFAEHINPKMINIVAPDIKPAIKKSFKENRFRLHKMAQGLNNALIQSQLNIAENDIVIMNTVAIYPNYRRFILWLLTSGKLKHAHWFIHEDDPKLQFQNAKDLPTIRQLIRTGRLTILVPSKQTAQEYNIFFETNFVRPVRLKVNIPQKLQAPMRATDFEEISFVTSGSPWDGRKGQFMLLNALLYFEHFLRDRRKSYRNYRVTMLALGKDYISRQLVSTGKAFLGDRFVHHSVTTRVKALEITKTCNVTVCSSLNESFALFVAEGMAMGHPIIRNHSSGWHEQIPNEKNGFLFDNEDLVSLAKSLEKILDKELSNEKLLDMSKASQQIAAHFAANNYYSQIIQSH